MANLGYAADPTNLPEKSGDGFAPLQVGANQPARAIAAEIRGMEQGEENEWGTVTWEFEFLEGGPNAGRRHWERVTIRNPANYTPKPSGDPATIGQQKNNQFAAAIGLVQGAEETENYLMKPVLVSIKRSRPYTNRSGEQVTDKSEIGSFKPFDGGAAPVSAQPASTAQTASAPAASGGAVPPWKRGK